MFKLDISALHDFEASLEKELDTLLANRSNCDGAMRAVAAEGFMGDAQVASAERFNDWINNLDGLTVLFDGCWLTCNTARIGANSIMKKCDKLPATLGVGTTVTPEDTGLLELNDTYYLVTSGAQRLVDVDFGALRQDVSLCQLDLASVPGASAAHCALSSLISSIDEMETRLQKFNTGYVEIVDDICLFESEISQSLSDLCDGNIEGQRNRLAGLIATESGGLALAVIEGAQLRGRGSWRLPANMSFKEIKVSYSTGYHYVKQLISGRYIPKHTSISTLARNKQLMSYVVYKVAGGVGKAVPVVTTALGIAESFTRTTEEYSRNPYLPESIRLARSQATAEVSAIGLGAGLTAAGIGAGAGIATGASVGVVGGPVGIVAGAAIGFGAGLVIDYTLESDFDRNGKPMTEDYIDWRSDYYHDFVTENPDWDYSYDYQW